MNKKKANDIIKPYLQERKKRYGISHNNICTITYNIWFGSFFCLQLKLAGIKVKDFWSFIQANQMLDKLYIFSKKCEKMSPQEQIVFLSEAEKVFDAFDKIPDMVWEDEYRKYSQVLDTYKNIRVSRWNEHSAGNNK